MRVDLEMMIIERILMRIAGFLLRKTREQMRIAAVSHQNRGDSHHHSMPDDVP
jgi:hypothetical protein